MLPARSRGVTIALEPVRLSRSLLLDVSAHYRRESRLVLQVEFGVRARLATGVVGRPPVCLAEVARVRGCLLCDSMRNNDDGDEVRLRD